MNQRSYSSIAIGLVSSVNLAVEFGNALTNLFPQAPDDLSIILLDGDDRGGQVIHRRTPAPVNINIATTHTTAATATLASRAASAPDFSGDSRPDLWTGASIRSPRSR